MHMPRSLITSGEGPEEFFTFGVWSSISTGTSPESALPSVVVISLMSVSLPFRPCSPWKIIKM